VLGPDGGGRNYDFPKNAFGESMPVNVQEVYEDGGLMDVEVVLSAHHKGHFIFKACPIPFTTISPTQECFDAHPLEFVADKLYNAPISPTHPERVHVAPFHHPQKVYSPKEPFDKAMLFQYTMRLPTGIVGDLVLIQWYYVASNSGCAHDGYDEYPWPEDWILNMNEDEELSDWESKFSVGKGLNSCGDVLPPDGNGVPEQFWNCAEVSIVAPGTLAEESIPLNEQLQSDKTIIGYWASWQWYDRLKFAEPWVFDYRKYTRVNFAFFQTNEQGDLFGTDSWADPNTLFGPYNWNGVEGVDTKYCSWDLPGEKMCAHHFYEKGLLHLVKAAGAEIWPSIGGWSLSDPFPVMAKNEVSRTRFAEQCVELIEEYGFDGIDIDWEYPGYEDHSGTPDDTHSYNLLLQAVREKLQELGEKTGKFYGLTAALPCGTSHINNIDIPTAAKYLTELNLMTYDYFGAWSPTTGANAPLYSQNWGPPEVARYSIDGCVKNWVEGGGSPNAINIGLPFYGRSYEKAKHLNETHTGKPDETNWWQDEGSPQYFNIVNKLPDLVSIRHELTKTQYAYNPKVVDNREIGGMVSYDDEEAICDKTGYALEHELNGFIVWEMSGDLMDDYTTPLIDAVHAKLRDPALDCKAFKYDVNTFSGFATPFGNEVIASFARPGVPGADGPEGSTPTCPSAWFWGILQFNECKSYFSCTNGKPEMSTLTHCPDGELFDEMSGTCKEASQITCSESVTAGMASIQEQYDPDCSTSAGWKAGPDCMSYFRCHGGELVSSIIECSPGTLYDITLSSCRDASQIICSETLSPTASPVIQEQYDPDCSISLAGANAGPDCKSYFRCLDGELVSPLIECPPGTLYDETLSMCNFAGGVKCTFTSPPSSLSSPEPTRHATTYPPTRNPVTNDPPTKQPTSKPITDSPTRQPTAKPVTDSPTKHPVTNEPTRQPLELQNKPLIMSQTPRPTRNPTPRPSREPSSKPTAKVMFDSSQYQYEIIQTESNLMTAQTLQPTNRLTRKPKTDRPTRNPKTSRPTRKPIEANTMASNFLDNRPSVSHTILAPTATTNIVEYHSPSKGEESLGEKIKNQIQQQQMKMKKQKIAMKKGKKLGGKKRGNKSRKSSKSKKGSKPKKSSKSKKRSKSKKNENKDQMRDKLN